MTKNHLHLFVIALVLCLIPAQGYTQDDSSADTSTDCDVIRPSPSPMGALDSPLSKDTCTGPYRLKVTCNVIVTYQDKSETVSYRDCPFGKDQPKKVNNAQIERRVIKEATRMACEEICQNTSRCKSGCRANATVCFSCSWWEIRRWSDD